MSDGERNPPEVHPRRSVPGPSWLRPFFAYLVALGLPVAVAGARLTLGFTAGDPLHLITFVLPIAAAAVLGGMAAGLVATATTAALCAALLIPPTGSLLIGGAGDALQWLTLVIMGVMLSVGGEISGRALRLRLPPAPLSSGRTTERLVRVAMAVWLLVLAASASVAVLSLKRHTANEDEARRVQAGIRGLRAVSGLLADLDVAESRLLLTGHDASVLREHTIEAALRREVERLRGRERLAERRWPIEEIEVLVTRRLASTARVLDAYRRGGATAGLVAWRDAAEVPPVSSALRTRIDALLVDEEARLQAHETRQASSEHLAVSAVVAGGGLSFLLAPLALRVIGRGFAAARRDEAALREDRNLFQARLAERAHELESANASLARSEAHLRTLWDALPDPIWLKDQAGRYVSVNLAAARLSGLAREELLGQNDERLFDPDLAEQLRARHTAVIISGQPATFEEDLHFRHDGARRTFETTLTPLRDEGGAVLGVLGIARDTTERKRAAQAVLDLNAELETRVEQRTRDLQASLQQARDLYDQAPCGYHSLDIEGRVVDVNATELRWLGYAREELLGRSFRELLTNPSLQVFDRNFARFKQSGRVVDVELELQRRDGSSLPVLVSAVAVKDAAGKFAYSRSTLIDFTELKRARARLMEVNRELESFNYSVSHDLKAPLRAIDGYARLLGETCDGKLDEDGRHFLDSLTRAALHMSRLIDDLLAYARIERRSTQLVPTEPRALVQALLDERADEIERRGVQVEVTVPEGSVDADREGLALALRNLIDNALKFTAQMEPARLSVGGRFTRAGCLLWVRDNGLGFDMQFHDRIFEIFQRLNRAEEYEGTGIGLALVRKALQRMDGHAWAQSEPGQGATFFLEIGR